MASKRKNSDIEGGLSLAKRIKPNSEEQLVQSDRSSKKQKKKQKKTKKKKNKPSHNEYLREQEGESFYDNEDGEQYPEEGLAEYELLMHTKDTLPPAIKKFWWRRYDLFSKFDGGVYMSEELWFSVTPEPIAKYIADLFYHLIPDATSCLDICCGGGGNTIQFAQYFANVGAIDNNKTSLYCTEHNVAIYGVQDNVWTLQADWNEISSTDSDLSVNVNWIPQELQKSHANKTFDFIFSSPPWGGTFYNREEFDLYTMEHFPIVQFLTQCKQYTENIGLYLPRSLNLDQLSQATFEVFGKDAKCRVIYINHKGRPVALLALFGDALTAYIDELDNQEEEQLEQPEEEDEEEEYQK